MKKFLALCAIAALFACGEKTEENAVEETEVVEVKPEFDIVFDEKTSDYEEGMAEEACPFEDDAVCAVDLTVKCTINPKMEKCAENKMPRFIFMEDESLERPTKISYKVFAVKTIDANTAEIYTTSECDGGWFGLCKGNIIYVVSNKTGEWVVKDIYAIEKL